MLILHVGALFPAKLFLILTNSKDYNGSNFDFNINIHSHTNAYLQVITFQYIYEIEFKNFFKVRGNMHQKHIEKVSNARRPVFPISFPNNDHLSNIFPSKTTDLSKDYSIEIIYRFLSHAFN